jgi:hypothetical protein
MMNNQYDNANDSERREGPPRASSAPSRGSAVHAATSVGATSSMTMIQALRSAMDVMLERDDNVVVYGQDVGYFGGVFRCTEGLRFAARGGNPVCGLLLPRQ